MSASLYLIETRARNDYICPGCQRKIQRGDLHFRHDPYPLARIHRGEPTTHWCRECILSSDPGEKDFITKRIRVPAVQVVQRISQSPQATQLPLLAPFQVEFIGFGSILSQRLSKEPSLIHSISPGEFEEFICDRLFAMGFEPQRVGSTNRKDGGIDVVFWPRLSGAFPFLGAAQIKHHRDISIKEGPATVRDFAGVISGHEFNAGIVVTNTSFSPDAQWFARERAKLLRLRDFTDIRRWMFNNFSDEAEWREIPKSIELSPGIIVRIRGAS